MSLGAFRSTVGRDSYLRAYTAAMAQLPPPSAVHDVPTAYGTVRTYAWGEAAAHVSPVLLLPGRSSGTPMWAENLADFLPYGQVLAMDALGDAGLSEQTAPLRSQADQAAWVDQALGHLGVTTVHAVGHSFGGATAAAFAAGFPKRLASLALLEPTFTLAWPPASVFWWGTISSLPVPQSWRDHALAAIGGIEVSEVRQRTPLSEMIALGGVEFSAALPMPKPLTPTQLAALTMPTYVAIAERRSLVGGRRAAHRAALIPEVDLETWPGTTHSLPMQVHEPLGQRLRQFWRTADERR